MPSRPSVPKYLTVKRAIMACIERGDLKAGEKAPSISEIMRDFTVSKVTAVRALTELESEGLVRREHGRGTFVTDDEERGARPRRCVAVIAPGLMNPFHVEILAGLERRLREHGAVMELSCTDYDLQLEREALARIAKERRVAGVVLMSSPAPHDALDGDWPSVPLVAIDACPDDLADRCVFISCDNAKGGQEAARHLVDLGHTRVGYVNFVHASPERLEGFRAGLAAEGVALADDDILTLDEGADVGYVVLDFVRTREPSALFAVNDMIAMQAMSALHGVGCRIPEDVSLMGYDDVETARYLDVPLTTIEQHEDEIAERAAECLIECFTTGRSRVRPREIVVVPNLVVRASTAPPTESA
ncbi:MAG: substrate-binding domain-containing protein [bacterium]|nr:substrate-binding domain-containing protein [bacterium]